MTAAIIGTLLLFVCACVVAYAHRPTGRSSAKMRAEALRRYSRDVDADQ